MFKIKQKKSPPLQVDWAEMAEPIKADRGQPWIWARNSHELQCRMSLSNVSYFRTTY